MSISTVYRLLLSSLYRYADRDAIIENMRFLRETCFDLEGMQEKIVGIEKEMQTTADALRSCIEQNAAASITEEEYREQYERLYDQFEDLEAKRDKLSRKLSIAQSDAAKLDEAIRMLEMTEDIPMGFDPMLWRIIVEKVLVGTDGTVTFTMVGGKEYRFRAP